MDHASLQQTVGVFYRHGIPLVLDSQVLLHLSVKALACPVQQKITVCDTQEKEGFAERLPTEPSLAWLFWTRVKRQIVEVTKLELFAQLIQLRR